MYQAGRISSTSKIIIVRPEESGLYLMGDLAACETDVDFKKQFGFEVLREVTIKTTVLCNRIAPIILSNTLSPSSGSRNKPNRIPVSRTQVDHTVIQKYILILLTGFIWPRKGFTGETAGSFLRQIVAC